MLETELARLLVAGPKGAGVDEGGAWLTPGPWSWLPDGSAPLPNGAVSLEEWPPLVVAWDGLTTLLEDLNSLAIDVG